MKEFNQHIEDVSATTEELSAGMEETAASTQEMNAVSIEIDNAVESIASKAQEGAVSAGNISRKANDLTENFLASQRNALKVFLDAKQKLEKALEESKAVEQINTLTDAILQVTSQTNLLALNAAIEAARAGEAGRGFAVVADEIRKLAQDSQDTATQIQSITRNVIQSVENLSNSSNRLLSFMATDVDSDYKTMLKATDEYKNDTRLFDSLTSDFSVAAEELSTSMSNMIKAINEITCAANEGANGTANIAQKAGAIVEMSNDVIKQVGACQNSEDKLTRSVAKFKL